MTTSTAVFINSPIYGLEKAKTLDDCSHINQFPFRIKFVFVYYQVTHNRIKEDHSTVADGIM